MARYDLRDPRASQTKYFTTMDFKEKLEEAKRLYESANADQKYVLETLFPELAGSEDERIRKALLEMVHDTTGDELWVDYNVHKEDALAWLEKQGEQKPFDYEHANIQQKDFAPKVELEKQGEQKPIEWDVDDDDKFFFLKARLKDYEDCIIYDEELSEYQKNDVRETTKEFLEWLDSIKERIGG